MAICENRAEGGFGWFKGDATTCAEDVLWVDLPALLLLCAFLLCFATKSRNRGEGELSSSYGLQRLDSKSSTAAFGNTPINLGSSGLRPRISIPHVAVLALTTIVLVVLFVMQVVEIVWLAHGLLGIGLLFLCLPALFLVLRSLFVPLHATNATSRRARPHSYAWSICVLSYVLGMCIVMGVKVHTMTRLETLLTAKKMDTTKSKNPFTIHGRQVTSGVITALYCVLFLVYAALAYLDRRRR